MTERDLEETVERPGARPALLTSLGVFGFLAVQTVAYRLIRAAREVRYDGASDAALGSTWVTEFALTLGIALVFAIGVFVCFWQIAPITGELNLARLLTRSLLAAAIGAACAWVFRFFGEFIRVATTPELRAHPDVLGGLVFDSLMDSLGTLVGLLPLVLLGAIALWGWLRWRGVPKPSPVGVATLKQ
jgi:hypothetical protein